MTSIAITGNTFPVKDALKALGGRWNADRKAWMVPADKADAARKLVSGATKSNFSCRAANYDSQKFNGYGRARGGFVRTCKTGGNCSSFGTGRSCGAPDCDGF